MFWNVLVNGTAICTLLDLPNLSQKFYLKAGDGAFSSICECSVDPGDDGVIHHFLSVAQILQDVECVSEEETDDVEESDLMLIKMLKKSPDNFVTSS